MRKFPLVFVLLLHCSWCVLSARKGKFLAQIDRREDPASGGGGGDGAVPSSGFTGKPYAENWLEQDLNLSLSSSCEETYGFIPCSATATGNLFLMAIYGYLLFKSTTFMSEGSEILLPVRGSRIIGGLLMPILRAFPDSLLILVSGLSGSKTTAQSQVRIGMGLLAGSTVMLLTALWGACTIVGKCDLSSENAAIDGQDTNLIGSGITTDRETTKAAQIMVVSLIPFIIVEIPQAIDSSSAKRIGVLVGCIAAIICLLLYCIYQKRKAESEALQNEIEEEVSEVDNPYKVYLKAVMLMLGGAILVGIFADPLVDAVDNFSDATSIPSFFISFIIMPLATNSSEGVSAIIFASRKKKRTASLTYSEIYGAVTMNNTLCLGVFLAIIYFRGLDWDFSAEVLVIVLVVLVMGIISSYRTTFPPWMSSIAFIFYPLTLAIVYVLDYVLGWL